MGAQAVKKATRTIPIVMPGAADPVSSGLVASLERPGGNITGLALNASQLDTTRLRLLTEALPRVSRVAVLWNPPNPVHGPVLRSVQAVARSLHLRLQPVELWAPEHFHVVFTAIRRGYADALLVLASPMFYLHLWQIADLAMKARLPAAADFREFAEAGGLLSYGPSRLDLYRRAAVYVDKILRGASPAELPVEQPTEFELVVNVKTATALGLQLPEALLRRATHLIDAEEPGRREGPGHPETP